jgi:predicted methyltransferase
MRAIPASAVCVVILAFASSEHQASAQTSAGAPEYRIPADTPAHIRRAVESAERTAEQRARDAARKPAEVLTLSGVEEGDHVIEFASVGLYYTPMLAAAVGSDGMVEMYDLPYTERFGGEAGRAFDAAHANAVYHQQDYNEVEFPRNVDAVFNILYYHDLKPNEIDTAALNAKLYDALEPGGVYVIVDHKAEDGSGWRDAGTIHRMGVETIVQEITAAGFELVVESDLLAHPEDDRTKMVFSPGTRGATDRALFVFRKPAD